MVKNNQINCKKDREKLVGMNESNERRARHAIQLRAVNSIIIIKAVS